MGFGDVIDIDEVVTEDAAQDYGASVPALHAPQPGDVGALARVAREAGPRDVIGMAAQAREVGRRLGRAAFYRFPVGGKDIEGGTIDLAYGLLPVWGRVVARVHVVGETGNRITLRGQAIDLLNVVAVERDYAFTLAPPPGKFGAKPEQAERWATMQMQAASSKAVRGAVFGMLPAWLVDAAIGAAQEQASSALLTRKGPNGTRQITVEEAANEAATFFGGMGIPLADLETIVDRPKEAWTVAELDELSTLARRIKSGQEVPANVRLQAQAARTKRGAATVGATVPGLGAAAAADQRAQEGEE